MVDLVSDYVLCVSTPRLPKNGPFSLAAVDNSLKVPSLYPEIYWVVEGGVGMSIQCTQVTPLATYSGILKKQNWQ